MSDPEPTTFGNAICSRAEVAAVRRILTPAEESIHRAHLVDIVPAVSPAPPPRRYLLAIIKIFSFLYPETYACAPASAPRCVPRKPCNSPTSQQQQIPEELLPLLQSKQCRNRAFRFVRAWAQGGEELSLVLRPIGWQEGQPLQHLAVPRGTFLINCKTPSPFCLKFARELTSLGLVQQCAVRQAQISTGSS